MSLKEKREQSDGAEREMQNMQRMDGGKDIVGFGERSGR